GDAKLDSLALPEASEALLGTLAGPWNLSFQPQRGAPASITLNELSSWSESTDAGVRYFAGTGTYAKTVAAPPEWFRKGAHQWIDLGDVKNMAEVGLNGKPLGIAWHAPYRLDLTGELREGPNELSIRVTNAWVNRLIGDEQPGATRYTFADVKPYSSDSKLLPSGLLGPVRILSVGPR